jgi:hypothetical protein
VPRPIPLTDEDVRVLGLAEHGYTYRPPDALAGDFEALVGHLVELQDRGLLRLEDGRIMKSQRGRHLLAGPCALTDRGREALEHGRRLGPRA